jgi:hypothetical protein
MSGAEPYRQQDNAFTPPHGIRGIFDDDTPS